MALLANKVVLVTGAGSGIGRAAALAFAEEGATVAACDINGDGVADTVAEIEAGGGSASAFTCDVSVDAEVQATIDAIVDKYERLDGAFNNAGIEGVAGPTGDYDEAEWDRVLAVNLKGVWLCMKHEIRVMKASGGAIVNMASALGKVGITNLPAYVASKHGVVGITRAAALDHSADGIRVNAVAPGVIQTPMIIRRIEEMPEIEAPLNAAHPIGRIGKPEEVAAAAAYLLSDRASFVQGEVLSVDGGYVVH
ncbi:MAG: SDR family oxidoreductase [Pseudomonadota bacterium]